MGGDDVRSKIGAAVQRLDGVMVTADLARLLVYWLGRYAELAQQRNGTIPDGLPLVQTVLAEAAAASGDSRRREYVEPALAELLTSGHEVDTADAATLLGVSPDCVRWHCRRGNLDSRRVGRQLMITLASIERLKSERRSA